MSGDANLILWQDLAAEHTAEGGKSCFHECNVSVLDCPSNVPGLNLTENLWTVVKKKTKDTSPNHVYKQM